MEIQGQRRTTVTEKKKEREKTHKINPNIPEIKFFLINSGILEAKTILD